MVKLLNTEELKASIKQLWSKRDDELISSYLRETLKLLKEKRNQAKASI